MTAAGQELTRAGGRFRWVRGTHAALYTLFVTGSLVLVNLLAARHPLRLDLSPDRRFQLSPQTRQVLAQLDRPVELYGFVVGGTREEEQLRDLLREYRLASPRVRVSIVDPERQPSLAREMEVRSSGTVVVKLGNRQRKLESFNLFASAPFGAVEFRGEQAVTRAIMELLDYGQATIYFVKGHGEAGPFDELSDLGANLQGEGFTVREVNLALQKEVPQDAKVLVLAGPKRDLSRRERELLQAFVRRGGRLAVWVDPLPGRRLPELEGLLQALGVKVLPGMVVDPGRALFGDPLSPVPEMRWHPVTEPLLRASSGVVLPGSRPLQVAEGGLAVGSDTRVLPLLVSTERAWAELQPERAWSRDPEDLPGPLPLGVVVERSVPAVRPAAGAGAAGGAAARSAPVGSAGADPAVDGPGGGEVVEPSRVMVAAAAVVGNSGFARNEFLAFQGNRDLAVNMLSWLAGESRLLTIRPRVMATPRVMLTRRLASAIFYGTTLGIPAAVLAAGVWVWWRRRWR